MDVELLLVPYDSGRRDERLGAGPGALVAAGLSAALEARGHRVHGPVAIDPPAAGWRAEIGTAFALAGALAVAVRAARAEGRLPLVLAGNCGVALGVTAGLGADVRVLWCDAHGDFNTPETTVGGFLDGMALATLTGRCWTTLAARIPGFTPVPDERVWLLGARDLDALEADALDRSRVHRLPAAAGAIDTLRAAADALRGGPLYLHLDLDVLDPADGRANGYAAPGGITARDLEALCAALHAHAPPAAVTVSAYDPAVDADGRVRETARRALATLLGDADAHGAGSRSGG